MSEPAAIASRVARTWLRYAVPLTVTAALVLAPWALVLLRFHPSPDQAGAKLALWLGWAMIATAWLPQLWLVAAAAHVMRARPSQLAALGGGIARLVRYAVPCAVAGIVVAIGGVALVVPGLVLVTLLALTGASTARGVPAALTESIATVRPQLRAVAIAIALLVVLDVAIGVGAQQLLLEIPVPKKPTAAQLAGFARFPPAILIALIATSAVPALALAALRIRRD